MCKILLVTSCTFLQLNYTSSTSLQDNAISCTSLHYNTTSCTSLQDNAISGTSIQGNATSCTSLQHNSTFIQRKLHFIVLLYTIVKGINNKLANISGQRSSC